MPCGNETFRTSKHINCQIAQNCWPAFLAMSLDLSGVSLKPKQSVPEQNQLSMPSQSTCSSNKTPQIRRGKTNFNRTHVVTTIHTCKRSEHWYVIGLTLVAFFISPCLWLLRQHETYQGPSIQDLSNVPTSRKLIEISVRLERTRHRYITPAFFSYTCTQAHIRNITHWRYTKLFLSSSAAIPSGNPLLAGSPPPVPCS